MKSLKTLMLTALLALVPMIAAASSIIGADDISDDFTPAIPEPTSALLMLAGIATVVAVRRIRS